MTTNCIRTDSDNSDFQQLVALLDRDLAIRDGDDHAFYAQFNKTAALRHVVLVYAGDRPAACGALKPYTEDTLEVKRMFVHPDFRRQGLATMVLTELENWAAELRYAHCILETGKNQPEAIALYQKSGYIQIPNYGQYAQVENSVCMRKAMQVAL